jgi:recombinational DNA repair ATPase RecF
MASVGGVSTAAAAMAAKPRLMILKMVLENFKSYGGVKEIGPFHKSFSSVVGPNGSGKSNVIDAMLFVFGKRASKMRMTKVRCRTQLPSFAAAPLVVDYSYASLCLRAGF